jgi:hypothetical protein
MNRDQWKAFQHSIRIEAHAFKAHHGGHPAFRRSFTHNGAEWIMTRYHDFNRWQTYTRAAVIRQRPLASLIHAELDCAAEYRRKAKAQPWGEITSRKGARLSIKCAREWRLEGQTGWLDAQRKAG